MAGAFRLHARQLLLPEIGEVGQAELCSHVVRLGGGRAAEVEALYLSRAGVHAFVEDAAEPPDATARIAALAGRPELCEAAAFLAGAFAAVEEIKRVVRAGRPGALPDVALTGPEERS